MPQIESNFSSYLNASPETVFENISELTRHAAWAANALTIEAVSEGPAAVGSEYRSSCRFMGKDINAEIKVTELEAPMRYGFSVKDNNGDFQHDLTLRAQNGGTQADHRVTGQLIAHELAALRPFWGSYDRATRDEEVLPEHERGAGEGCIVEG